MACESADERIDLEEWQDKIKMLNLDDGGLNRERKGTESKPCPALSAITDHTKSERQKVKNERIREDRQTKTKNNRRWACLETKDLQVLTLVFKGTRKMTSIPKE